MHHLNQSESSLPSTRPNYRNLALLVVLMAVSWSSSWGPCLGPGLESCVLVFILRTVFWYWSQGLCDLEVCVLVLVFRAVSWSSSWGPCLGLGLQGGVLVFILRSVSWPWSRERCLGLHLEVRVLVLVLRAVAWSWSSGLCLGLHLEVRVLVLLSRAVSWSSSWGPCLGLALEGSVLVFILRSVSWSWSWGLCDLEVCVLVLFSRAVWSWGLCLGLGLEAWSSSWDFVLPESISPKADTHMSVICLFDHPTERRKLSWSGHCSKGVQSVPNSVYHNGYHDQRTAWWQSGAVVNVLISVNKVALWPGPATTWMGNCLHTDKLSPYLTSHSR